MRRTPDPECVGCEYWREIVSAALAWLELAARGQTNMEDLAREYAALRAKVARAESTIAERALLESASPASSGEEKKG